MDLETSEDQRLISESAEKFLREHYTHDVFRALVAGETRWREDIWAGFAEMGWLGLPFAEKLGGFGMGGAEVATLMEAFGRALVLEPYIPTVILCGKLMEFSGSADHLPGIIAGQTRLAFAHDDGGDETAAKPDGDGYVLTGSKKAVTAAPMATAILFSAKLPEGGTGVFLVSAEQPGLNIRPYFTVDGGCAADITLADVKVGGGQVLGDGQDAGPAINAALAHGIAAACADAVGAMAEMVEQTLDYTQQREQFGQPVARFQVLQHRLVDMKLAVEEARASALFAALSLDAPDMLRDRAVSGAKAKVGRAARFIHQAAIQTHGAIGTTDELMLGWYAKRLIAFEANFGSTREHRRRYGGLIADPETAASALLIEAAE